jgi:heptosyltransferase-2
MRRAVFLDRDDTLMAANSLPPAPPPAAPGDIIDPALVRLLPGVAESCARLKRAGYLIVVMSNQGVVARGGGTVEQVEAVNARLRELLPDPDRPDRSLIDAIYYCPYHPRGSVETFRREHDWRKPSGGMITAAASELDLDLASSWLIGDADRDIDAGRAAGISPERCIRIGVAGTPDLPAAAARILAVPPAVAEQTASAGAESSGDSWRPLRILIVLPSWVGDAVMATPALRLLRASFPGAFIGGLMRPGIDEVLAGAGFFDEIHVDRAAGVMGPKHAAAKVRPRRYDTALLLTNSFSTALITRLAGIPRRIGFSRDARGFLLTDRLQAPTRADGRFAPVPAVAYYWHAARALLQRAGKPDPGPAEPYAMPLARLELAATPDQEHAADELLARARLAPQAAFAILNPGGNNPAKRWPPDRFAAAGRHLLERHGLAILVNGAPAEADLAGSIVAAIAPPPRAVSLAGLGVTLGSLKAVVRRARLMITNDTGPRHLAAAFGVPVVSLFGPTDPRWTTIPVGPDRQTVLAADPALPPDQVADDHPDRCRIDRITLESVIAAADRLLTLAPAAAAVR